MKQIRSITGSRVRWLSGAAIASALLLGAAPAQAQSDAEGAYDDEDTIIVTAQRREENLQDVPLSVATLPPAQLTSIFDSGDDVTALAARVPGLYVESSNGRAAPRFYIRGLGNTDFDLAASQPVSVLMDDVVLENVTLKSSPIFDIEQVEVLRGPQGTLFGRNTPAGIVKFTTVKPSQEFDFRGSLTAGSFGTVTADVGVGGGLVPDLLAARLSVLYQRRSDWIDNAFTGEDNAMGGFEEFAVRGQLLLTPTEALSLLGNLHYRNLDGTAAIFRANILGPGNNKLNANYDRDTVYYDAGGNNPQSYEGWGGSLKADYDFGGAVFTAIGAYESSKGSSRGDIDGGNMVTGPGFIPFPSDTQDSIDLDQYTAEFRVASTGSAPLSWQVGTFFFDSDFTVLTEGFAFPPPTLVRHKNQSWAAFGQGSYQATESFKVTAGLRYTEDDKTFTVIGGSPLNDRSVSDERLSWDVSLMYDLSADVSLYTRLASGFRAPTIQGRDVAFFNPPSVAASEKILSMEAGFKALIADRRVRLNGAFFHYTVNDPQFTAVGGAGNLVQLLNADRGTAWGFELDSEFRPVDSLIFTIGLSYNKTKISDSSLAVGVCAQCTVTDPMITIAGTPRALVDGNPFPNAPELIADFTARYSVPLGSGGELFAFTDWAYQGKTNLFLYESLEFNTDDQVEGGLRIGYARSDGSYEIALFARNITDADNVKGGIDFNNNTGFVNEPRTFGISVRAALN
ncbi:TonB-dependent receptor [Sphingomonas canadensis]|uniref:TonB-dependent receptor n=1 Tax=Sphingomonas canadensis TaxID=1219257 RepID=A0ABW3H4M6_9SPHN|nr:TonB-dependent receptor [Sphingomonas canadensis]MCW3834982.1 TonB-dependent receptor [Sphingomonas canadensis]